MNRHRTSIACLVGFLAILGCQRAYSGTFESAEIVDLQPRYRRPSQCDGHVLRKSILRTITTDSHFTLSVAAGDVDGDAQLYLDYPCQNATGASHYMLRGVSGGKKVM